jgi:hypothetical protein
MRMTSGEIRNPICLRVPLLPKASKKKFFASARTGAAAQKPSLLGGMLLNAFKLLVTINPSFDGWTA